VIEVGRITRARGPELAAPAEGKGKDLLRYAALELGVKAAARSGHDPMPDSSPVPPLDAEHEALGPGP
jgi:hypothetical protein